MRRSTRWKLRLHIHGVLHPVQGATKGDPSNDSKYMVNFHSDKVDARPDLTEEEEQYLKAHGIRTSCLKTHIEDEFGHFVYNAVLKPHTNTCFQSQCLRSSRSGQPYPTP